MATSRSSSRRTALDALALHESVTPDRWCVTRSDLIYLRQEVWRAIQCGEIRPLDVSDPFLPSDDQYGPNIHTVNTQYIMPVTDEAGKVSWALMRHPDGLDCNLFISHACLRVPVQGLAFLAVGFAKRLVLHAGQPAELGHRILFAISQQLALRVFTPGLYLRAGGAQPSPQHLHQALVRLRSLPRPRGGKDHIYCQRFEQQAAAPCPYLGQPLRTPGHDMWPLVVAHQDQANPLVHFCGGRMYQREYQPQQLSQVLEQDRCHGCWGYFRALANSC